MCTATISYFYYDCSVLRRTFHFLLLVGCCIIFLWHLFGTSTGKITIAATALFIDRLARQEWVAVCVNHVKIDSYHAEVISTARSFTDSLR